MANHKKDLLSCLQPNSGLKKYPNPCEAKEERIALIKLNTPISSYLEQFKRLWDRADLKAVVDGAANELYQYTSQDPPVFLPDIITGDFDSAEPGILQFYREKGVEIISTPDQNETDFTKCLRIVIKRISQQKLQVSSIIAFVSFAGRVDHVLGNMNTLFIAEKLTPLPVYLISGESLVCLISPGFHNLRVDSGLEEGLCGLIPLGQAASRVTTTGLRWNLTKQSMEFGGLVSTSNKLDGSPEVTVQTDTPLLWTMSIKL